MEIEDKKDEKRSYIFLYFAAMTVHLTSFTAGIVICWNTPISPKLETNKDNPLGTILSIHEISWLASLVCLGATIGPFIGGYIADTKGRKATLVTTAVLSISSFSMLAFCHNLYLFYIARFIGGISVGACFTAIPMYIGEIADVHNRGPLVGLVLAFIAAGNLYCFVAGPFISVMWFSVSCMAFPIIFLAIAIPFIPESPCFLLMKGAREEAIESLKKFGHSDVESKLVEITESIEESSSSNKGIRDIFNTKYLIKALSITIGLVTIQQLTAFIPILLFIHTIFQKAVSSLSKEFAAIIVGTVQVSSAAFSSAIVEKVGRRPLVLISATATSLCLLSLSLYFYLLLSHDLNKVAMLPLVTLILYIFSWNVGLGPVAFTVLGEIFPPHAKSAATSLTTSCCFIVSFAVTKAFPLLASLIDSWFAFLTFGLCNAVGIVFLWIWMPETKGKTLKEIIESFQ